MKRYKRYFKEDIIDNIKKHFIKDSSFNNLYLDIKIDYLNSTMEEDPYIKRILKNFNTLLSQLNFKKDTIFDKDRVNKQIKKIDGKIVRRLTHIQILNYKVSLKNNSIANIKKIIGFIKQNFIGGSLISYEIFSEDKWQKINFK